LVGLITHPTKLRAQFLENAHKAGARETALIDVLVSANNEEIKAVQQEDPRVIADVLNGVGGDFKKVIVELLKGIRDHSHDVNDEEAQVLAEKLYKAGEGKLGTDEIVFVDILAKRSPAFLSRVAEFYHAHHKHTLEQAIKRETSGHFEEALLGLLKPKYVFIADRLFSAMDGIGTNDTCLVYYFSILEKQELQEVARIFQQRHTKTIAEMIKGDTSGDYKNLLLALLQ